jgi:hypothetical protein
MQLPFHLIFDNSGNAAAVGVQVRAQPQQPR